MTTQIEASDLVGAVAGLVPGSPLAAARGARAVARDQIQAAESALFTRGTATIPRRRSKVSAGVVRSPSRFGLPAPW